MTATATAAPLFTDDHDQDPDTYAAGAIALMPDGLPGGIHRHTRGNGRVYTHSHTGFDAPHRHRRDDTPRTGSARCDAEARRGTGTGSCDRPLDGSGYCDRPGDHIDQSWTGV